MINARYPVSATRGVLTSRRNYENPPVHEVILNLVFQSQALRSDLDLLPAKLVDILPIAEKRDRAELVFELGPSGQKLTRTAREDDGWSLSNVGPTRVAAITPGQVSLHAVRPGPWPTGPYAGWKTIRAEMLKILESLATAYGNLPIQRAGVRYLNRIAIPKDSDLAEWVTLAWQGPSLVRGRYAFNLRQTWERIEGHDDLSATIGIAKIEIPDTETRLKESCTGVLLDIDVFNLWVRHAPSFNALNEWTARAHDVENALFEDSITPALRARMKEI